MISTYARFGKGFNSTDDMGDIPEQTTNHQPKFGKLMAARKCDTENPSTSSCHDKGNPVISGTVPDL